MGEGVLKMAKKIRRLLWTAPFSKSMTSQKSYKKYKIKSQLPNRPANQSKSQILVHKKSPPGQVAKIH